MPSKKFSESFKAHFKQEADYSEGIWTMDYMDELDEDLASDLSHAMAKVEWKISKSPLWNFAAVVPSDDSYKPLQFNQSGSTADFPVSIEFNGIQLCPRLNSWDQYDKMAGLF